MFRHDITNVRLAVQFGAMLFGSAHDAIVDYTFGRRLTMHVLLMMVQSPGTAEFAVIRR
jgi:hypothetical protein